MEVLSCGCWYRTPAEVTGLAGYSDDPIVVAHTCPRCMRLRLKNIASRMKPELTGQLDFFAESP